MMQAAKNILKNMKVREISIVDDGDNPHADVLIFKRRDAEGEPTAVLKAKFETVSVLAGTVMELAAGIAGEEGVEKARTILGGMNMDLEQLNERLGEIETNLETVTKARDDLQSQLDAANARLSEVEKERDDAVAKAKPSADEDEILKSLPEPVRKRLEDAERVAREATEAVEKAASEREQGEYVSKARALKVVDADGVGGLMYRIAKGKTSAEDAAKFEAILKQAGTINDKGEKLFEAIGKSQGGDAEDGEAQSELDEAITNIQKAKPSLTREQAYAEALDANPGLYDRINKRRAA